MTQAEKINYLIREYKNGNYTTVLPNPGATNRFYSNEIIYIELFNKWRIF